MAGLSIACLSPYPGAMAGLSIACLSPYLGAAAALDRPAGEYVFSALKMR